MSDPHVKRSVAVWPGLSRGISLYQQRNDHRADRLAGSRCSSGVRAPTLLVGPLRLRRFCMAGPAAWRCWDDTVGST